MAGKRPTHILKAIDPETGEVSGRLGAGWKDKKGHISIELDMCVHLDARDGFTLIVFPVDKVDEGDAVA